MRNNYGKLFENLNPIKPPKQLRFNILMRIALARRRSAGIKMALAGLVALAAFILTIFNLRYAANGFSQTGFYQYFSLIFSDTDAVLIHWKEFALSLAESAPVLEIAALFAVVFILLGALKFAANSTKNFFLPKQFNH